MASPASVATSVDVKGASVDVSGVTVSYGHDTPAIQDATFTVDAGETLVLLGPSGCGKTTLLRAIAGLERAVSGSISIGQKQVSGPNIWIAPEHRNVGMVFQDGALFPHLTVAKNIAFGLRGRPDADRRVRDLLELVDLAGMGERLPGTLSGGQQQRVALARALAPEPSVLLLDEPFSALDAALRAQVRSDVARILRSINVTSIVVTHDQDEAFVLGDKVAVLREGRILQTGRPWELYQIPASPWIAEFVGEANILPAEVNGGIANTPVGLLPVRPELADGQAQVLVRPEHLAVSEDDSVGASAVLEAVEYYGHDARWDLVLADGTSVSARVVTVGGPRIGDTVGLSYRGGPTQGWSIEPA